MALPPEIAEEHAERCPEGDVIKYGVSDGGDQIYLCKSTGVRWTDNGAEPGRRVPAEAVAAAIRMYYDGLSLRDVKRSIGHIYDDPVSAGTIHEWVRDYSDAAEAKLKRAKPEKIGRTWVADEMVVSAGGRKLWIWTVMSAETRYILANHVSRSRNLHDAGQLFRRALNAAGGKRPERVVTDGLPAYPKSIKNILGQNVRHTVTGSVADEENNNLIERLNGTIRERTKVMRGMKSRATGVELLEGWTTHYNHFRPHESLDGRTPAQAAGVKTDLKSWEDVTELNVRDISRIREARQRERSGTAGEAAPEPRQMELAGPVPRRMTARRRAIREGTRPARTRLVK